MRQVMYFDLAYSRRSVGKEIVNGAILRSSRAKTRGRPSLIFTFTLPTPPRQQNCHSDYFLDQLRPFPSPFGQSSSVLPITEGLLLDA